MTHDKATPRPWRTSTVLHAALAEAVGTDNAALIVSAVNSHDALVGALKDLLCFASPGGVHGTEPEGWSEEAKRVCAKAREVLRLAGVSE